MLASGSPKFIRLLVTVGICAVAVLIGLIVQKLVSRRARQAAGKTANPWDDVLVESLPGYVVVWFFLIGLAVALKFVHARPEVIKVLQRATGVIGILSAVSFGVRFSRKALQVYVEKVAEVPTTILKNFASIVIYLLGGLIILDYLGFSITALLTALGVGGVAVALALQDTLSNLFSGLSLLMSKKVRPGDYVQVDGDRVREGNVTDITWRNTTIRGLDNNLIIVPNSRLAQAVITNVHLPGKEMAVVFPVTVGYGNDLRAVERLTLETAREVLSDPKYQVQGFEPFIRYTAFTESGVQFNVVLQVREFTEQYPVKHAFFLRLHERYRKEGVSFPIPARMVKVEKE